MKHFRNNYVLWKAGYNLRYPWSPGAHRANRSFANGKTGMQLNGMN